MSRVSRSRWQSDLSISSESPLSGSLTVYHLREFVKTLDENKVDDKVTVTAHHANDTRHFIRLSVVITETLSNQFLPADPQAHPPDDDVVTLANFGEQAAAQGATLPADLAERIERLTAHGPGWQDGTI